MPSKTAKAKKNTNAETSNEVTENNTQKAENPENVTEMPNRGEIVDIEWEDISHIFEYRKRLEDMESYFANMCLQFEKSKANLMTQITYGQNDLYMMAEQLQKSKNIDENLTYELKLPSAEGEKGFFVRKDD